MDIDRVHYFHVFEETGSLVKAPEVLTYWCIGGGPIFHFDVLKHDYVAGETPCWCI